jgi:2-polyprenyl-3-methyl-5-hydroxy-6-metoxy-1,4-benzoquinol methylase
MQKDYKTRVYENYINSTTTQHVDFNNISKYYLLHEEYFKKNYLPYMPADKNALIVDVGCGIGAFLIFARNQGYKNVKGIDLSELNIEVCREKGLTVEKAEAISYLSKRTGEIDIIVFNEVIEHLEKQEVFDTLDVMKDALSNGGILMIKTPNMANPYTGPASLSINITHQLCFTEISLRQVLHTVGFSDTAIVGTDIYVKNNIINLLARLVSKLVCFNLYMKSWLFGRKTIKIFTKNLLAVAKK